MPMNRNEDDKSSSVTRFQPNKLAWIRGVYYMARAQTGHRTTLDNSLCMRMWCGDTRPSEERWPAVRATHLNPRCIFGGPGQRGGLQNQRRETGKRRFSGKIRYPFMPAGR